MLGCRHVFHKGCIDLWFERNTQCCLCKRDYSNSGSLSDGERSAISIHMSDNENIPHDLDEQVVLSQRMQAEDVQEIQ